MKTSSKVNLFHVYIFLLLVLPIVNNYRIFPVAFIYLFGVFGLLVFLYAHDAIRLKVKITLILYYVYAFIMAIIMMAGQRDTSIFMIGMRLVYLTLVLINFYIFAYQIWDYEYAIRIYKTVCLIISVLIIIQYGLSLVGRPISLIPSGLISNTGERLTTDSIRAAQVSENRFSTFFLEPAHQSQYTVPCIAILLLSDITSKIRNNLLLSIVMTVAVFATTSMQGILACGIVWSIYLFDLFQTRGAKKFTKLLFLIPIIIVVAVFFWQQPIIQYQIYKKATSFNSGNIYLGTSMYRRLKYGWDCYADLDLIHKIFGCGYDNAGSYLYNTGIGLRYVTYEQIGYMSGLSKMFCEMGIVGSFLNLSATVLFVAKNMNKNRIVLALLVTWFVIMLTSSAFDGLASLIPLIFMMNLVSRKNDLWEDI